MRMRLLIAALLLIGIGVCSSNTEASVVAIPEVSAAPTIDGKIDCNEWSQSAVTCGFHNINTGYPAEGKTTVSLCYDSHALYMLFECYGEDNADLKALANVRDADVWSDPNVEIFLASSNWPLKKYLHMGVNCNGCIADEMVGCIVGEIINGENKDPKWNANCKLAAGKYQDKWIAEMALDWSNLGIAPVHGTILRANFGRNANSLFEISSWSDLRFALHQPEKFGEILLAGDGPVVAISDLPGSHTGKFDIKANILDRKPVENTAASLNLITSPQGKSKSATFSGNDGVAIIQSRTAFGDTGIEVAAKDANGQVIWSQGVQFGIQDMSMRARDARARIRNLKIGKKSALLAIRQDIVRQISNIESALDKPYDENALQALYSRMSTIDRRISDLSVLVESYSEAAYIVTNPVTTQKIQPTDDSPGPIVKSIRIAMAKNEYEPAQIVVCPVARNLRGVRVKVTSLSGPNGAKIPGDRIVVNPIGFVTCKKQTPYALLKGTIPDVMLPNRSMNVSVSYRQPFFITIKTTAGDSSGIYRGKVTVTADNAKPISIPIKVRVYNITLPVKSHLRTAFVMWGQFDRFKENTGPNSFMDTYIRYTRAMLQYRLSPSTFWEPKKGTDGKWDFSQVDRFLSETVPAGLTTYNIGGNGTLAAKPDADFAKAYAEHLKARGWWNLHYVYGLDEAPGDFLGKLQANYKTLIDAVPDIKIMQTGWNPDSRLNDLVHIWCPLTSLANLDACRTAEKNGDEIWWYVCCGPTAPYANMFVDYPGIDHRILGWMTYSYGIKGFLYWGVDVWSGNDLKLDVYDKANYSNWNPNSFGRVNGDGYLFYPGHKDTPVPSLRIALLRDGIEDYDIFTEAKALADSKPGAAADRLKKLLDIKSPLISSLTQYTQNGEDLLVRREAIMQAAEELVEN